jgi:AraC-like DNA-binding protein
MDIPGKLRNVGIERIAEGYIEYPVLPRIARFVACLWSLRPRSGAPVTMVLPDACTDLIWSAGKLFVAGPDTRVNPATAYQGQTLVGLRFRPGAGGAAFGLPLAVIADQRVPFDDLWGARRSTTRSRALFAALKACEASPSAEAALRSLCAVADLVAPDIHRRSVSLEAARRLADPRQRVVGLHTDLGFSQRQLQRLFLDDFGYGAKMPQRVLRFQRFLASPADMSLAERAVVAGFADQSHLNRDCVELSGLTPRALLATV